MGRFLDEYRPGRQEWKFTYKGSELVEAAKRKLAQLQIAFTATDAKLRQAVADATNVRKDPEVDKLSKEIEKLGPQVEECEVFVHEFSRDPERVYHLTTSDVTYFNLHVNLHVDLHKG